MKCIGCRKLPERRFDIGGGSPPRVAGSPVPTTARGFSLPTVNSRYDCVMEKLLVERGPGAALWLFALAAQVSGFSSAAVPGLSVHSRSPEAFQRLSKQRERLPFVGETFPAVA